MKTIVWVITVEPEVVETPDWLQMQSVTDDNTYRNYPHSS